MLLVEKILSLKLYLNGAVPIALLISYLISYIIPRLG